MDENIKVLFNFQLIMVALFVNVLVDMFKKILPDKKIFHPNFLLIFLSIVASLIKCYTFAYCTAENVFMEIVATAIISSGIYGLGYKHLMKWIAGKFLPKDVVEKEAGTDGTVD